jgi:hypothetical protein
MRKIEKEMVDAVASKKSWQNNNTCVVYECELDEPMHARMEQAKIYLYGNHIATYLYKEYKAYRNTETFNKWPTRTTKSRLKALGLSTI